jgi:parallel beta-helix repeat protein
MSATYIGGKFKAWADGGTPLTTGRLYTYETGTTTHKNAFTGPTFATPCTYTSDGVGGLYIAMNARGEAELWTNGSYTMVLKTAAGATVWSADAQGNTAADQTYTPAGTGAVVTTVQTKLRESVSIEDFIDTGVTPDEALTLALAHADVILGKAGTIYEFEAGVSIPSGKTLLMDGVTFKRKTGSGVYDILKNSDQVGGNTDIVIRGLTIDGNAAANGLDPVNPGDRFSGISLITVTGKSEVSGCTVTGTINNETGAGIYVYDSSDVLVQDNICYDNDRTAIYYRNGARNKFIRNICYSNAGSGISGKDCLNAEFEGNQTYSNGSGGNYTGLNASCLNARVVGNLSYSNTGAGIAVGETASADGSDAKVIGNTCYLNTLEGIYVSNSARVKVLANTVYNNVRNNIRILGGANYCTVMGNTAKGASGVGATGVYVDDGDGHQIIGNQVSTSYSSGIYIDSTANDGICTGNVCFDNCVTSAANAGITLDTTTGWTVANNKCFDTLGAGGTQTSGISLIAGSNNHVIGNQLNGNKTNPILETTTPAYSRRLNRIGTGPLQASFTAGAGATHSVANTNAQATSRIKVWGTNAAGALKPVFVSAVTVGTDFTITPDTGTFAGTENYAYEIE